MDPGAILPETPLYLGLARTDREPPEDAALGPAERARLERITAPLRAAQYRAGRRLLRLLGARVLGVEPASLVLNAEGRPRVLEPSERPAPFLSLAHSGPWVLGAACARPCGVDLEQRGTARDWDPLARHLGLPGGAGEDAVLEAWTLREARFKAPELGEPGAGPAAFWRLDAPAFAARLVAVPGAVLRPETFGGLPASFLHPVPLQVPSA